MNRYLVGCSLSLLLTSSCTLSLHLPSESIAEVDLPHECSFVVRDFAWENATRTHAEITEQGVSFRWELSDTIGVYPDQGAQIEYVIEEGKQTLATSFDGGAWTFKQGHTYTAFHPYDYNNHTNDQILIDYTGQCQTGRDDTKSVCRKDFIYAPPTTPQDGQTDFIFEHIGSFLWLTLDIPCHELTSITRIALSCGDECIPVKQVLDIKQEPAAMTTTKRDGRLDIQLNDITVSEGDNQLSIYAMLPTIDTTAIRLAICAEDALGNKYRSQDSLSFDDGLRQGIAYRKQAIMLTEQSE